MGNEQSLISSKCDALDGTAKIPGDKSISHRALILGLLSQDETMISGLLEWVRKIGLHLYLKNQEALFYLSGIPRCTRLVPTSE